MWLRFHLIIGFLCQFWQMSSHFNFYFARNWMMLKMIIRFRFMTRQKYCCVSFLRTQFKSVLQFSQMTIPYTSYDNVRPHVRAQHPEGTNPMIQLKRLPPNSPFLNSTEMTHSAFKAAVKRTLGLPEWQQRVGDRQATRQAGMNMQQWRCDLLQQAAVQSVDAITQVKWMQWYNYTQT